MTELLLQIKEAYDIVFFDVPSINTVVDASIVATKTDATIIVAKQRATSISHIENAKRQLDHVDAKLLGIILNNVDRSEYKKYLKNYNRILNLK
jgi:Mrp family chromosome partitioning ATPase